MVSKWTEERVNKLRNLWKEGYTARQISDHFGDVSRNAVIGKANRLGLSSAPAQTIRPEEFRCSIIANRTNSCQWPFGDPNNKDFSFCGKVVKEGYPYCDAHCQLAYRGTPAEVSQDRRPRGHANGGTVNGHGAVNGDGVNGATSGGRTRRGKVAARDATPHEVTPHREEMTEEVALRS